MGFRTFFTVNTNSNTFENVESFRKENGFLIIEYYPDINCITNDIFRLDYDTKYIPMENVIDIDARDVRL